MDGFNVVIDINVAWGDMDAFAHVNNAKYFSYFEQARIAYFVLIGIAIDSNQPVPVGPILASTSCQFRAPVKFPDSLQVGARVTRLGKDRFTMEYKVVSDALGCVAAKGEGVVVAYDYDNHQKCSAPKEWVEAIIKLDDPILDHE